MPAGRPTTYSQEIALEICEWIAEGKSVRSYTRQENKPAISTIYKWIIEHEEFSKQYALAKEDSADTLADEILEIADNSRNDWMEDNDPDNPGFRLNGENIQRARLRVDTRKWIASKLKPKKYGERITQEHTGKDGGPIETKEVSKLELARRIAYLLTPKKEDK